jgi:hypothetical protein
MAGYQNWKEQEYVVTNLSLDPLNPRLPEIDKKLSQQELIQELIKYEDVYEIAKSITENGYYPVERLICIKENNKKVVVEGNRRLAALKLLISPESAPSKEQNKYRKLSEIIPLNQIKKVKVTIAPDRKSANHYIRNKHTSPTVRPWKPIQQAKFYKNLVESGSTISGISKEYVIPLSEIKDSLQLLDMYNIACNLHLSENIKNSVLDTRQFPATTLQRAYQNQKIKNFLGIDFDANKKLIGKAKKEEFTKGYKKLITDIVEGNIDSRKLNKNEDIDSYLKSISDHKPNLRKKGKFHINDLVEGEKKPKTSIKKTDEPARKAKKKSTSLIPSEIKCTIENEKIRNLFKELKKLKVEDYINSVSILLRVLLELSLVHYLDVTDKTKDVCKKLKNKHPKQSYPRHYSPTLSEMLNYILCGDDSISNLNPQAIKALRQLVSSSGTIYSKDFLDSLVHNKFVMPSEPQLRTFWEQLEPIFKVTLMEPAIEE